MSDHKGLTGSWGTDWPVTDTIGYVKETTGMGTSFLNISVKKYKTDQTTYIPYKHRGNSISTITLLSPQKKKVSDLKI